MIELGKFAGLALAVLAFFLHASSPRAQAVKAGDACIKPVRPSCGSETWKIQKHHLMTNKGKKEQSWKKKFEAILVLYGLSVDDKWNITPMRHKGPHPPDYHEFVYCQLQRADKEATAADGQKDPDKLKALVKLYSDDPVRADPCLL